MKHLFNRVFQLYVNAFSGLPRKVWLLSLVMLVNRSGAMVVAFLSVYLISAQDYNALKAGYVMAAFGAGGVVGNYVGGLLNDRYGSWHIQLYSLIGAGFLHILLGQVNEFWALCGLAFVISLVTDAFRPANRAAIAVYAPRERLTQAYGLQRLAANLGFSVGPALGGWLIYNYGYELMFWGDGLTFLVAAALFFVALPADETARPLVENGPVGDTLAAASLKKTSPAPAAAPVSLPAHHQPWLLALALVNVLIMICFFQLFTTFPVYLKTFGIDEQGTGLLYTISGVFIVLFEMPLVYSAERRWRPVPVMLAGAALIGGAYLLLPLALSLGFAAVIVMMVIMSFGEIYYMPFASAYVASHAPPARRGEYLGVLSASYSVAFVACPLLAFWLAESFGYVTATMVCCGCAFAGMLTLTQVNKLRRNSKTRRLIGA